MSVDPARPPHGGPKASPSASGPGRVHARRILVAATGMSPQVVTETVYALHDRGGAEAVPTEIHVVTTAGGARRVREDLLDVGQGWLGRLVEEWELPPIDFGEERIHVLEDDRGRPLEDIRTAADNTAALEGIARLVRRLTLDPDCLVHGSIAGGRKTMGFALGYAMMMYGRVQDRLAHVLVEPGFESSPDFFYPSRATRLIETRDRGELDASTARVTLAEIPLVTLRYRLPDEATELDATLAGGAEAARRIFGPPTLEIDLGERTVTANGQRLRFKPVELALLLVFAERRRDGEPPLAWATKDAPDPDWAPRYLRARRLVGGRQVDLDNAAKTHGGGISGDTLSQWKSRLKRGFVKAFGDFAEPFLIERVPGGTGYELALAPDAIAIRYPTAGEPGAGPDSRASRSPCP